jgi:hypothetical protein
MAVSAQFSQIRLSSRVAKKAVKKRLCRLTPGKPEPFRESGGRAALGCYPSRTLARPGRSGQVLAPLQNLWYK